MSVQKFLDKIKNGRYGADITDAIIGGIKKCYDDASVNHDNANMEVKMARGTHNTLNDRLDNVDEIQAQTNAQLSNIPYYVSNDFIDGSDDTAKVKECIRLGSLLNKTVILRGKLNITQVINVPSNVRIKGENCTLTTSSTNTLFNVLKDSINVSFDAIDFDLNDSYSTKAIVCNENVGVSISKCKFKNFNSTNSAQVRVIEIKPGSRVNIDNVEFDNIKCKANGTIGDYAGANRLIITTTTTETITKPLRLDINNIKIKNCFNYDSNNNIVEEDTDSIVIQHGEFEGYININNVDAYNFGKRVIKIQANNVNVSNITCKNDAVVDSRSVIAIYGDNVNVNNVVAYGKITIGFDVTNCKNVNVSNFILNKTCNSDFSILLENVEAVNINAVTINGCYDCVRIWGTKVANVNFDKCNFNDCRIIIQDECRTTQMFDIDNCLHENIMFNNCKFNTNISYTKPFIEFNPLKETNIIKDIFFNNCKMNVFPPATSYAYGYLRFINLYNLRFVNSHISTNISGEEYPVYFAGLKTRGVIDNCKFENTFSINKMIVSKDTELLLDHTDCLYAVYRSGNTNSKLIFERCKYANYINSGYNTDDMVEIV